MSVYGKFLSALLALAIVGFGIAYLTGVSGEVMSEVSELAQEVACYTLREHEGAIALFKDGEDEPIAVYELPMESISPTDSQLLKEGIRLSGMSDVIRLLEDLDIQ